MHPTGMLSFVTLLYLFLSLTLGFLYAIREAIVNDLVEYDLNGSDYVSCIVSEEYKDTAKYFIFIDISILFLIPLIIIVSNYARVREYVFHPLFATSLMWPQCQFLGEIELIFTARNEVAARLCFHRCL